MTVPTLKLRLMTTEEKTTTATQSQTRSPELQPLLIALQSLMTLMKITRKSLSNLSAMMSTRGILATFLANTVPCLNASWFRKTADPVVLPSLNTITQTAHVKQLKPKTEAHIREEKFLLNFPERSPTVAKSREADPVKTLTVTASSAETSVLTHLRTQ